MFDKFEKLRDFETQTGQKHSDWDSLEQRLDKENKRSFSWISIAAIVLLVLIPLEVSDLLLQEENIPNSTIGSVYQSETQPSGDDGTSKTFKQLDSDVELNTNIPRSILNTTKSETPIAIEKDMSPAVSDADLRLKLLPLTTIDLNNSLIQLADRDYTPQTSEVEDEPFVKSFDLCIGLKSSLSNSVSNTSEPQNSWGTGISCNLKYNMSKHFALGFSTGISSEFNHNLNYSYITEIRSFFSRSDRMMNIDTKQMYSANFALSTNFTWCKRFVTGGGVYYNRVFQSISETYESGTGSFANLQGEIVKKGGYTDLLNSNEFGLHVSQTYMLNNDWGITMGLRKGLTNRVNTNYFANTDNKRMELSLMISKRIGL